ncbi:hypothetical protein F2P79_001905 [Pimephales promelas]|nr:hypothetical protein F2P79_001905 [Pimephales promelas]
METSCERGSTHYRRGVTPPDGTGTVHRRRKFCGRAIEIVSQDVKHDGISAQELTGSSVGSVLGHRFSPA